MHTLSLNVNQKNIFVIYPYMYLVWVFKYKPQQRTPLGKIMMMGASEWMFAGFWIGCRSLTWSLVVSNRCPIESKQVHPFFPRLKCQHRWRMKMQHSAAIAATLRAESWQAILTTLFSKVLLRMARGTTPARWSSGLVKINCIGIPWLGFFL